MSFNNFRKSGVLTPRELQSQADDLVRNAATSSTAIREFATPSSTAVEDFIKGETVGLVGLDKLKRIKEEAVSKQQGDDGQRDGKSDAENQKSKKSKLKKIAVMKSKLSFGDEDEDSPEGVSFKKRRKIDTTVDTSFIKSKEEEEEERRRQEELKQQLLAQQELVRQEKVDLQFSYYDGTYTPGKVTIKKGDQVWVMLDRTRKGKKEFHRGTVDDILLVKDNIIIPHHYEFSYFVFNKIETKQGLLFDFDNPEEDIKRLKVVHRSWYEKNKHIFPANVWREFDPEIDYSTYILRDSEGFVYYNQF